MWWRYLLKSLWGRSRIADKSVVSLTVLFPRRGRMHKRSYWCPASDQQEKIVQRRKRNRHRRNGHVVLVSETAKEGQILGLTRLVPKTWGKQIWDFLQKIPGPKCYEGRHFKWENMRLNENQFKSHSCNFWFLKASLLSLTSILCLLLMRKKERSHSRYCIGFKRSETKVIMQEK